MRIGQRLVLAVLPGILGVFAVAGLAYWGERGRQIPGILLGIGAFVTVLSLWLAFVITRDLARRIERLGRLVDARHEGSTPQEHSLLVGLAREALSRLSGTGKAGADELDPVERLVAKFDGEVARLEQQKRAADDRVAEARAESARLLYDAGDRIAQKLTEVQLPLHVLLDTPFGDLNENQEELIGAARTAAEIAATEARSIRELATLELSAGGRRDRVAAGDILRSLMPLLQAEARRAGVTITWDLAPALPAVSVDRSRVQEAVREVVTRVIRAADAESELTIAASAQATEVIVALSPVRNLGAAELAVERRVLEALGARVAFSGEHGEIALPAWR